MILQYVRDDDHRSGKWTSGAPLQHRTHSHTHFSLLRERTFGFVCVSLCVCVMLWQSCVVKLMITETWRLAHRPTGWPYGWELPPLLCTPSHHVTHTLPLLSSPPLTYPSIPPHHSAPADLPVLFNESLGSPAPKWKFHPRHPPSPHVSHLVLFFAPGGDLEGQAGAWCMESIRWD